MGAPMPAFSESAKTSAMSSKDPRIIEFPINLNVGAVRTLAVSVRERTCLRSVCTFLDVTAEIHDFPAHSGMEDVGHFLLRAIITRHDDEQLRDCCYSRGTEDG